MSGYREGRDGRREGGREGVRVGGWVGVWVVGKQDQKGQVGRDVGMNRDKETGIDEGRGAKRSRNGGERVRESRKEGREIGRKGGRE